MSGWFISNTMLSVPFKDTGRGKDDTKLKKKLPSVEKRVLIV